MVVSLFNLHKTITGHVMIPKKKKKSGACNQKTRIYQLLFWVWVAISFIWFLLTFFGNCSSYYNYSSEIIHYPTLLRQNNQFGLTLNNPNVVAVVALIGAGMLCYQTRRRWMGGIFVLLTLWYGFCFLVVLDWCGNLSHLETIEFENDVYHLAHYEFTDSNWFANGDLILYVCEENASSCLEERIAAVYWPRGDVRFVIDPDTNHLRIHDENGIIHKIEVSDPD